MAATLGFDFIQRTVRTTGVLLLIALVFCAAYLGVWDAVALFSGGIWSIINLIFLTALVRAALKTDKIDKLSVAGLALIKFPLLYLAGYFLLQVSVFEPLMLLAGFTVPLVVVVLKVLARTLLNLDSSSTLGDEPGVDRKSEAKNQLHEAR